ncbi:MAG: TrmB family transcriptional regulator [Candidatus Ranarchaeia archaeon]
MNKTINKLITALDKEIGLTPYESKAYVALLTNGPLTPKGVNQKAGIPRPRTYDVLNSLVGKGLLLEQPGKPLRYAVVEPRVGLSSLMAEQEQKMLQQLEKKRKTVETLTLSLQEIYKSQDHIIQDEKIWVTRNENAFIAKYSEAIKNIKNEMVIATSSSKPPSKKILDAVKQALTKGKTIRVIRRITENWTTNQYTEYENLIAQGDQIRHLEYDELVFALFDEKDVILWLYPENNDKITVWMRLPELAKLLKQQFDLLWEKATPALPLIKKLKKSSS